MIPLEYELNRITNLYLEMHELVCNQVARTREAVMSNDREAAAKVMKSEPRVNFYETTIDEECEDLLALHHPVASDLRLTIALFKMSTNMERIGDHAFQVAGFVYDEDMTLGENLIRTIKLPQLFEEIDGMFDLVRKALEKKDADLAKEVIKRDKRINKINKKIPERLEKYAKKHKEEKLSNLILISRMAGKLERTGDQLKNVAEEIIFYVKSSVPRHKKKNKKIKKKFAEEEKGKARNNPN